MTFSVSSCRRALLIAAFSCCGAFLAFLPSSVFSQESAVVGQETTFSETDAESESRQSYTIESIPGGEVIGDFVVGPGKTELFLAPGESANVELIITNRTGIERQFNFEVEDITGTNNPERPVVLLGDDRGPYTLKDYIALPEESIDLKHGERARILVTVSIPSNAEPGGRYGSVLVTTVSKDAAAGNTGGTAPQSAIISRVGSLFFVVIEGDTEIEGKLEGFTAIPEKRWFFEGPIRFGIYFRNNGSVHLNPYGEMRVTNILGEEVGFMEIGPWFALPDSLRFREVAWDREFLFGKYTARININRGYDDIIDTMEYTFWIVPWKSLLVAFGGVFVILFLLRLFFRTFEFKRKSRQ